MKKTIVGKQTVDYVSKKTNQQVTGVTLHVIGEDSRVNGYACETIFVSGKANIYNDVVNIPLNTDVEVGYNRWGNVDTIIVCKK